MKYEYPLSEFQEHLKGLSGRPSGDSIFGYFSSLRDYFGEFYEEDEAREKMEVYLQATSHIDFNADEYDTGMFAVSEGKSVLWISEAVQFAVHWFFTTHDRSDWLGDSSVVDAIKAKARERMEAEANT